MPEFDLNLPNVMTSAATFKKWGPKEVEVRNIVNNYFRYVHLKIDLAPATMLEDCKGKTDCWINGNREKPVAIRNRDSDHSGTDLGLCIRQPVKTYEDFKNNIGRDVSQDYVYHICRTEPTWIHIVRFEKLKKCYELCLEWLDLNPTNIEWGRSWTEYPENLPDGWNCVLKKFLDKRPPNHPKIIMYIKPTTEMFTKKELVSLHLINEVWTPDIWYPTNKGVIIP